MNQVKVLRSDDLINAEIYKSNDYEAAINELCRVQMVQFNDHLTNNSQNTDLLISRINSLSAMADCKIKAAGQRREVVEPKAKKTTVVKQHLRTK